MMGAPQGAGLGEAGKSGRRFHGNGPPWTESGHRADAETEGSFWNYGVCLPKEGEVSCASVIR